MRIWSIHPKYLDAKGLVALWRETLLAKQVLQGNVKAYQNHPQLDRFKKAENPVECINHYLKHVYDEAARRGYNFSKDKIDPLHGEVSLTVTKGQLMYETQHLLNKLKIRDNDKFKELKDIDLPETHPMFFVVDGGIEDWEIVKS